MYILYESISDPFNLFICKLFQLKEFLCKKKKKKVAWIYFFLFYLKNGCATDPLRESVLGNLYRL